MKMNKVLAKMLAVSLGISLLVTTGCGDPAPAKESVPEASTETVIEQKEEAPVAEEKEEAPAQVEEEAPEETPILSVLDDDEAWEEEWEEDWSDESSYFVKTGNNFINGSFKDGMNGFEAWSFVEDNITYEANASEGFKMTMKETGTEDWHVQFKQSNVKLEQGKWYRVSVKAKASINRDIMFQMQRDGSADEDWRSYAGPNTMALTGAWKTYTFIFQMKDNTDKNAILNFSLGTVNGKRITKEHTVRIANIKFERLADNFLDTLKVGNNMIANSDFTTGSVCWNPSVVAPGQASVELGEGKAVFAIQNPGTQDWNVQLKQSGFTMEKDQGYRYSMKIKSDVDRVVKIGIMDQDYITWYGGGDIYLKAGEEREAAMLIYNTYPTNTNAQLMISMGRIDGVATPAGTITMTDIALCKYGYVPGNPGAAPAVPGITIIHPVDSEILPATNFSAASGWAFASAASNAEAVVSGTDTVVSVTAAGAAASKDAVSITKTGIALEQDCVYSLELDATAVPARPVSVSFRKADGTILGETTVDLTSPVIPGGPVGASIEADMTGEVPVIRFKMEDQTVTDGKIVISMGAIPEETVTEGTVTLHEISLKKTVQATATEITADGFVIHSTDIRTIDQYNPAPGLWIVNLNAGQFGLGKGQNIKISADFTGTGDFAGLIGSCYGDDYSWVATNSTGVKAGKTVHWELRCPNYSGGGAQLQFSKNEGTLTVSNLKMETYDPSEPLPFETIHIDVDGWEADKDSGNRQYSIAIPEEFQGKNVRFTVNTVSDAAFSVKACGFESGWSGWTGGSEVSSVENEATASVEVKDAFTRMDIQFPSISGSYIEITDYSFEEFVPPAGPVTLEDGTVRYTKEALPVDADSGNFEIAYDLPADKAGKKLTAIVELESDGYFNGMLAGFNESWSGWTDSNGQKNVTSTESDATNKATFSVDLTSAFGKVMVRLFTVNGTYIDVKSVTYDVDDEGGEGGAPASLMHVAKDDIPNGKDSGNPELDIMLDGAFAPYVGKSGTFTVTLSSDGYFNGMLGAFNGSWSGWTDSNTQQGVEKYESTDNKGTWTIHLDDAFGKINIQFFWIGGTYMEVESVTFTEDPSGEPEGPVLPEVKGTASRPGGEGEALNTTESVDITELHTAVPTTGTEKIHMQITLKQTAGTYWGGCIGVSDNSVEGNWQQVSISNELGLVYDITAQLPGGEWDKCEIQLWWAGEDVTLEYEITVFEKADAKDDEGPVE